MSQTLKTISPADNRVYVERALATPSEIERTLAMARRGQAAWKQVAVAERAPVIERSVAALEANWPAIAEEISWQRGRPIKYSRGEVRGLVERARYMAGVAADALADLRVEPKAGFTRFIRHEPLGVGFVVAPWNYPYLTAVNAVVPAILAGNAVIPKHSQQAPLCAERFAEAFAAAGLPDGVFQYLHLSHADSERIIAGDAVDFVAFTGPGAAGQPL